MKHQRTNDCPVWSCNEWDPLEEVVVGSATHAHVPVVDRVWMASINSIEGWTGNLVRQGQPHTEEEVIAANRELDAMAHIMSSEGIVVRRPEPMQFDRSFSTPDWSAENGRNCVNPRDLLMVVGDEIIETPCAMKNRTYEVHSYRTLLADYFRRGAKWTSAPKPRLRPDSYNRAYVQPGSDDEMCYPISEAEPLFDAADFVRCGRDIFGIRSVVTNALGFEWLRRHLGPDFRVHEIETTCKTPMHIDTTFLPLAPGKALANPKYCGKLPDILKHWDILWAPEPIAPPLKAGSVNMSSYWLSMNVLSLDEERMMIDKTQTPLIAKLKDWGFKPVPMECEFFSPFGGAFHCATLDIRRRGEMKSYF